MGVRQTLVGFIGGLTLAFVSEQAVGYPVTWQFAGEIRFVRDPDNFLAGAVTVGSPFSGSFTFESDTPDSETGISRLGQYDGALTGVNGQVGSLPFTAPMDSDNTIEIQNDFRSSTLDTYLATTRIQFVNETLDFAILLLDGTGTAFTNDLLLLTPPDLDSFDVADFLLVDLSEDIVLSLRGGLTSLIPDPATLLLLGLGVIVASRKLRRDRM